MPGMLKRARTSGGGYVYPARRGGRIVTARRLVRPSYAKGLVSKSNRAMLEKTYVFKRTVLIQGLLQSGVNSALPGGCVVGLSVSLDTINVNRSVQGAASVSTNYSVPGASDMTNLFQQYKIDKFKIRIVPSRPDADIASTIPTLPLIPGFPTLITVTDYDDNNATTSVAPLQECGDNRIDMLDKMKTFTVRPKFVGVVTGAPGTTVAGPPMRGFLDVAQPSIEHNAIKFGYIAQAFSYADAYVDIYYTMRGSK